tara:strand:- start:51 stop:782 length:732 start_codon:yes stop_codon:yes gene_type:complete
MPAAVNGLKECDTCRETKPVSEYHKHSKRPDGCQSRCKSCRTTARKTIYKDRIRENHLRRREANKNKYKDVSYEELLRSKESQTKRCFLCERQLLYKYFWRDSSRGDGFQNKCKQCKSKEDKQHHSKPEVKRKTSEQQRKRRSEMSAGIYMIRNIETSKIYIGQSTILYKRLGDHRIHFKNKTHDNLHIKEDIIRWGADSFELSIIQEYPSDTSSDILFEHEQRVIDEYLAEGKELYNIRRDI